MPPVRKLVQLIGSGIGAAREGYKSHQEDKAKASNAAAGYHGEDPPQYLETDEAHANQLIQSGQAVPTDDSSDDELEDDWALDDAADAIDPPAYTEHEAQQIAEHTDPKDLVAQVVRMAPHPSTATARLPLPVVLPQRRPRTKARGFVRAYAPVLDDVAIDQQTWLLFLKNLHLASKASKGLNVVFIAATAAGVVPEMITQIVSAAVQVGAGAAIEMQRRHRANTFLDQMNEQLFKPRGLFAMVVAYKPDAKKLVEVGEFDPDESVAKYAEGSEGWKSKMRASSGKNYGTLDLGDVAPLVYPAIEEADEHGTAEQRGKRKGFQKFMGEYGDRRARAEYQKANPDSALAGQPAEFKSRYADPNHAASSGSIISLATGGRVNPLEKKLARRQARRNHRAQLLGKQTKDRSQGSAIKRALQENVCYLMVVNMPSEQELAAARARMEAQERERRDQQ